MGARGPQPAPIAIQKARGSWRFKGVEDVGPVKRVRPEMPSELEGDEIVVWDHLTAKLDEMEVLQEIDGIELSRYCELYIQWRKVMRILKQYDSPVIESVNSRGDTVQKERPEFKTMNTIGTMMNALASKMGLTPSDRVRLASVISEKESEEKGKNGRRSGGDRRGFFE